MPGDDHWIQLFLQVTGQVGSNNINGRKKNVISHPTVLLPTLRAYWKREHGNEAECLQRLHLLEGQWWSLKLLLHSRAGTALPVAVKRLVVLNLFTAGWFLTCASDCSIVSNETIYTWLQGLSTQGEVNFSHSRWLESSCQHCVGHCRQRGFISRKGWQVTMTLSSWLVYTT